MGTLKRDGTVQLGRLRNDHYASILIFYCLEARLKMMKSDLTTYCLLMNAFLIPVMMIFIGYCLDGS